jgi:hypothetical protein
VLVVCRSQMHFGAETPLTAASGFSFGPSGRTRCMLVGSNDRAIDIVHGPVDLALGIGLLLHGLKETLPDTRFAPAIETAGHRAPRTIAFRQIAPRGTGAQHPQDAVEDASMIQSGSTRLRFLRWKQRLEPLPLRVGEFFAFHTGECTPPARVCKHALVLQLYFWPRTPFVVIKLSHPLVPAPPRGPFQNVTDGLLGRQHKAPEEAANLGDAQWDPPLRAALNAARLCNGPWSNIFLGSALSCRYPARTIVSSAYAHMAKVICRYHPAQLRTS